MALAKDGAGFTEEDYNRNHLRCKKAAIIYKRATHFTLRVEKGPRIFNTGIWPGHFMGHCEAGRQARILKEHDPEYQILIQAWWGDVLIGLIENDDGIHRAQWPPLTEEEEKSCRV